MIRKYYLSALSIFFSLLLSILMLIGIFKVDLLDTKITILIILLLMILIIFSFYAYFSRNTKVYNVGVFFSFLLNIILLYNIVDLNSKYDYIMDIFRNENKYVTYNVYVQRKTTIYDDLSKLCGRKVGVLNSFSDRIENEMDDVINAEFLHYKDISEIEKAIYDGEIQSFILTEEEYRDSTNIENSILKKVRIIYTDKYKDSH